MKTILKYSLMMFAAVLGVACNDIKESAESVSFPEKEIVLTATREGLAPGTRSFRLDDGSVWWSPSEEVSVFYGAGSNGGSKFVSMNSAIAETVELQGSVQMAGSGKDFWAVYPYSEGNSCDGSSIITVIPDQQTGVEGNFSNDVFPTVAKSSSLSLAFWNICGGIKFFVSRNDIKAITFKSNGGEPLAGKVMVTFENGGKPTIASVQEGNPEITLFAPDGGTFKPGRYYYMTLLPGALSSGFTMTFYTKTERGVLSSVKPQTIKRSVFGILKNIDSKVNDWSSYNYPFEDDGEEGALKSITFVPEQMFADLGLISAYEIYAPRLGSTFPYVDRRSTGSYLTSAPIIVSYRFNPETVEVDDYDFVFVNRSVYTKASSDNTDLVTIVSGPIKNGDSYDFEIKLNKAVETVNNGQNNDIIALKAVSKKANSTGVYDTILSDFAYIGREDVKDFLIIHKDGEFLYNDGTKDVVYEYDSDDPKYYRWEKFVEIGDDTDYNAGSGIATPKPGKGTNPAAIALPYNGSIDLADYVETYSIDKQDVASTLGINPTYTFKFAGKNDATGDILYGTDPDKVVYLAADVDKTNQNKFIKFEDGKLKGSKISVNNEFVSLLSPAIGRTPLVYVESKVGDVVIAECLIKIEITAQPTPEPPVESRTWDVFIWHDAIFPNALPATASFTGKSGTASAPHQNAVHEKNFVEEDKDLNVTWDEVNPWVLDDAHINMSYEEFNKKYDLGAPQLILDEGSKEPGAVLPAKDKAVLVDPADINTYYSVSGTGLAITSQSPANWKQSTNIVDLKIDNTFKEKNKPADGKHYVYVVYQAKKETETKYPDVVVKFSFMVEPHVHDWTILKNYNDKTFWILNPDYIQGPQDLLIEPKPAADAYYGNEPYKTYGAVSVTGPKTDLRSSFVEHFKDHAACWKNANEESDYAFKIYNYTNDIVDIVEGGTTTAIANEDGYATVTISGANLKKIAEGTAVSPDILVKKPAGLSVGKDILVQVTELCSTEAAGTAIKDLKAEDYGMTYIQAYYYLSFRFPEAVDLGLPSGLKWATMNVGASAPEEYGDYFAWGEKEPKSGDYSSSTYKWCNGSSSTLTKYNINSSYGTVDNKTVLDLEDDAAHVNWGGSWRMPTDAEWTELRTKCTWTWTSQNGVNGRKVTGPNGNSIFLPAAGCRYGSYLDNAGDVGGTYWSSSLYTVYPDRAWSVSFDSGSVFRSYLNLRYNGFSVRPVYGDYISVKSISLDKTSVELRIEDTYQLASMINPPNAIAKDIRWTSSNNNVATIDENGLITAVASGIATITAYASSGVRAICDVTVKTAQSSEGGPAPTVTGTVSQTIAANDGDNVVIESCQVMAKSNQGIVVSDATGDVYLYFDAKQNETVPAVNIGDMVKVEASKDTYGGVPEFKSAKVTVVSAGGQVVYPEPKNITPIATVYESKVTEFIQMSGKLTISGNYYNVELDGVDSDAKMGSFYAPLESLGAASYDGKKVTVNGYFSGLTGPGGKYINIVAVNIGPADPNAKYCSVSTSKINVKADATSASFQISTNADWTVESDNQEFTVSPASGTGDADVTVSFTANATDAPRVANIKVSCPSASYEATVVVTQAKPVSGNAVVITADFTIEDAQNLPQGSSEGKKDGTYTVDGYTFTFHAADKYYQAKSNGAFYLLIGKQDSYIEFPAMQGKSLVKVEFLTGVFVSENVIGDIAKADGTRLNINDNKLKKGTAYTWELTGEPGAAYRFVVTNAYNMQFQTLTLTYD